MKHILFRLGPNFHFSVANPGNDYVNIVAGAYEETGNSKETCVVRRRKRCCLAIVNKGRGQRHGERYLAGTRTRRLRPMRPQGVIIIDQFSRLTTLGNNGVQLGFHLR